MSLQKLLDLSEQSLEYNLEGKQQFARLGRSVLKLVAKEAGFVNANIRFQKGGIATSGDLILETKNVYIHLNQFAGKMKLMYRGKHSNKTNQYCQLERILDGGFVCKLKALESSELVAVS
ncbi:hypothetical protein AB4254_08120 [Vibrio breoganii]